MRIGFDAKRAFFNNTGLGNYSRTLISSLLKEEINADLYLFTPKEKIKYKSFLSGEKVSIISPKSWFWKKLSSLWRSLYLGKIAEQNQIDLYHGLSHELPLNIPKDIAKVLTVHDLIFLRHKENYNPIDIFTYKWKIKKACQKADKIIAISEQTKRDIIDFLNVPESKIKVIYQDCDERFKKGIKQEKLDEVKNKYNLPDRFLLSVGALNFRKNNLTLIKSLLHCPNEVNLVIAGNGEQRKKLETFVQENNLSNRVSFLGYVPDEDLPALYNLAHIFTYPSIFEGFGIPILEALHSGTIVLTGDNGCFPEVGGNYAIYVNQLDPESIAKGIMDYWGNDEKINQKLNRVKTYLSNFNQDKIAKQVIDLYNETLQNKGKIKIKNV